MSYIVGQETSATLKAVPTPAAHQVALGRVVAPDGAAAITADMITDAGRLEAHPALNIAKLVAMVTNLTESLIDTRARLTNLERWSRANGHDPETLY